MRKIFVIASDIMAFCIGVMVVAVIGWIVGEFTCPVIVRIGKTLLVIAAAVFVVATVTSYVTWKHGGAPDDKEGRK
jgi:F0F1-type ATP synthase assembly protein I